MNQWEHLPVLCRETMMILAPQPGDRVLDVTLGLGGHAAAFLEAIGPAGELHGLDADAENLEQARLKLTKPTKPNKPTKPTVTFHHANFGAVATLDLGQFNVIFADLGLSSPHVDDPTRGFTYRHDAPLDLRFDRSRGKTAAELIALRHEDVVAGWLREYGELRQAGRIATELCKLKPQTTGAVKAILEQVCGRHAVQALPLVFQALRIAVNDELTALDRLLEALPGLLSPGGRAGVIAYHSLEDRRVKQAFRQLSTPLRSDVTGAVEVPAAFTLLTKKPIVPDEAEVAQNPRSRSAKLRAIERQANASVVSSKQ